MHFKYTAAFAAIFLNYIARLWDMMHWKVRNSSSIEELFWNISKTFILSYLKNFFPQSIVITYLKENSLTTLLTHGSGKSPVTWVRTIAVNYDFVTQISIHCANRFLATYMMQCSYESTAETQTLHKTNMC